MSVQNYLASGGDPKLLEECEADSLRTQLEAALRERDEARDGQWQSDVDRVESETIWKLQAVQSSAITVVQLVKRHAVIILSRPGESYYPIRQAIEELNATLARFDSTQASTPTEVADK